MLVRRKLEEAIEQALGKMQGEGFIPSAGAIEALVERPSNPVYGDYASTIALRMGRTLRRNPLEIARKIVDLLPSLEEIEKVEIAPPGFINFTLSRDWLVRQVEEILRRGEEFGNLDLGGGGLVQVEFVSVNPTGPLHIGHGRGAVLGDTLANLLAAAGYRVVREYYINDAGSQIEAFSRSLYARYKQVLGLPYEMPSDGYQGEYLVDLARKIVEEEGDKFIRLSEIASEEEAIVRIGKLGISKVLEEIKRDLELLGIRFDVWFSEQSLLDGEDFRKALEILEEKGYLARREGALWFTSSALGEDKDNVLVRASGKPTYFGTDIAYHYNKFLVRGFDRVINIWGADHMGHVSRLRAAVEALGVDPKRLSIIITQMVNLRRGEEQIKFSKRRGEVITLRELVEEVGRDVCRFFFLSRSPESQLDFDLELARKQSEDNPVYYIQYAHARIAGILRNAREKGIEVERGDGNVNLLTHDSEIALIKKLVLLPEIIEMAAKNLEPHHLPFYALDLATVFHQFYKQCRVISEDAELTGARLKLVRATQIALRKVLGILGISAPERM